MALPKHKISRSRRNKKRTHKKLESPNISSCSNCSHPKLPHRACPSCGYYAGKMVVLPKNV